MTIETDYLVVGAGAMGLGFTDALVHSSDADAVLVDRRVAPGGHWNDAYGFVRLHQPSACYGINSLRLGNDTIDTEGVNAGWYERATGAEVRDYFARALDESLLATGRVRFVGGHDYVGVRSGEHQIVDMATGDATAVRVRRALVDATYLQGSIPATDPPPFAVDGDAPVATPGALVDGVDLSTRFTVVGAGKTAMDTCTYLLDQGVDPGRIRWIRPRDCWLVNRPYFQPQQLVSQTIDGLSKSLEAAAESATVAELFQRLEAADQLVRIDPDVAPTMYRGATISRQETEQLRTVENVVRNQYVRRVEADRIHLDDTELPIERDELVVNCANEGIPTRGSRPIFEEGRITPQAVRTCQPTFNAAVIGFVEGRGGDDADKNRLCPPNPYPARAVDWIPNNEISQRAQFAWNADAELSAWIDSSRLNVGGGIRDHFDDPLMQAALTRYFTYAEPAVENLTRLYATAVG